MMQKMGYLNKLGNWDNVTLEIVGEIQDSRAQSFCHFTL